MNYEECIKFLNAVEEKVRTCDWEAQVDDTDNLLTHDEMSDYLTNFGLPAAKLENDECVILPENWITEEPKDSQTYKELCEKYTSVYAYMRHECSREIEALSYQYAEEDAAMEREYWASR